jgi:hypothetical protein
VKRLLLSLLVVACAFPVAAQNVDESMIEELAELQNVLDGRPALNELPADQRQALILQFRQDLRGMSPDQRAAFINEQRARLQQLSPALRDRFVRRRQASTGQGTTNRARQFRDQREDARLDSQDVKRQR